MMLFTGNRVYSARESFVNIHKTPYIGRNRWLLCHRLQQSSEKRTGVVPKGRRICNPHSKMCQTPSL